LVVESNVDGGLSSGVTEGENWIIDLNPQNIGTGTSIRLQYEGYDNSFIPAKRVDFVKLIDDTGGS
jgi:hypothetical protein